MFNRLKRIDQSVRRTREAWFGKVSDLFDRRIIDEDLWDELEELLIRADVGVATTEHLLRAVRERVQRDHIREAEGAKQALQDEMINLLDVGSPALYLRPPGQVTAILVVGVNGSGKTTSIAKLAHLLHRQGHGVLLAAGDTFRAAAGDQLKLWGERADVDVIAHQPGANPAAVVFDALQAAAARNADVVIADTAGRLHTKFNLMEELRKIYRVMAKADATAPHEVLLVLDATTGQNALLQARHFTEAAPITGIVLAKLDGTAKGGIVFAIAQDLRVPLKFVGTGEQIDDLAEFDAQEFVRALFAK